MGLQVEGLFRFSVDQIKQFVVTLRIPEIMRTDERDCYHAIEGLRIVLRHNTYPIHYMDMVHMFGRQTCCLSRTYRDILFWLHTRWRTDLGIPRSWGDTEIKSVKGIGGYSCISIPPLTRNRQKWKGDQNRYPESSRTNVYT